jgi:hypothetical protein
MAVFVVVPRYVRRSDAAHVRKAAERAGFVCRVAPAPISGYDLVEFRVALRREEEVVVEAFEIEVDELLHHCPVPSRTGFRPARFGGHGARVEIR